MVHLSSPIVTSSIQATALGMLANILAQIIDAHRRAKPLDFDTPAFLRFLLVSLVAAPLNFTWLQWLERTFPARKPVYSKYNILSLSQRNSPEPSNYALYEHGGDDAIDLAEMGKAESGQFETERRERKGSLSWKNMAIKWFLDSMTLGVLWNTVLFLAIMGLLKGKSGEMIWMSVKEETIPIMVAGYKIWPFASIISFLLIPVDKRIVFFSFVGVIWGIYLSLAAAKV